MFHSDMYHSPTAYCHDSLWYVGHLAPTASPAQQSSKRDESSGMQYCCVHVRIGLVMEELVTISLMCTRIYSIWRVLLPVYYTNYQVPGMHVRTRIYEYYTWYNVGILQMLFFFVLLIVCMIYVLYHIRNI